MLSLDYFSSQGAYIDLSFVFMSKLLSYLIPGVMVMILFTFFREFFVSPDTAYTSWFVYLSFFVYVLSVVVPCVIYYLRTPPGIDHRE